MAEDIYYLSQADRDALRKISQKVANIPLRNGRGRPSSPPDSPYLDSNASPNIYAARTLDIIPGLFYETALSTDTGTGTGTGTGTDAEPLLPTLESGRCQVYQLYEKENSATLLSVEEFIVTVYNIFSNDIPIDTWVLIAKDAYGSWWVIPDLTDTGGGGGALTTGADAYQTGSPFTPDTTWQTLGGYTTVLPSAGTYLVKAFYSAQAQVSALFGVAPATILARLHDGTNPVQGSQVYVCCTQIVNVYAFGSTSIEFEITVTGSTTLTLQGFASNAGGLVTWTLCQFAGANAVLTGPAVAFSWIKKS